MIGSKFVLQDDGSSAKLYIEWLIMQSLSEILETKSYIYPFFARGKDIHSSVWPPTSVVKKKKS